MEVYAVIWGSGSCDDHSNAHAFCGTHGIFKSEASAKKALEECKDEILQETLESLCFGEDEDPAEHSDEVRVYGSVEDGYFEIDYTLGDEPSEKLKIGSAGGTNLMVGGLEGSNVDLASEISEMITTQRGYQANTRIITVTDQMLEELVNMKR